MKLKSKRLWNNIKWVLYIKNLDVYVTGSNSKFLSTDIITDFKGRGDIVKLFSLTYFEFKQIY